MRVPTQRASRSSSATSAGKRISSSTSSTTSGGVKKRKLHSDAGTSGKNSGTDTATSSKKKLTKKTVVKKGDTGGGGMKTTAVLAKKLTPRKTAVLSVGLKRSKTQLKKLPSRKLSVVTIASKAHKKIVKSAKTLTAKKHMSVGKKGNTCDSGAGEERVKMGDTASEDVQPAKRPPGRPPLNKDTKASGRKPKANALVTVSTSINRAKKIAQQKNISLKKNNLKKQATVAKISSAVQENHQPTSTEEKKKGKIGRKKTVEAPEEKPADKSPEVKEKEETVEEKEDPESDSQEASKNQNAEKPSGKVGIKKTKDEEKTKKKLIKKKPKIEAESIAKEEVESVVILETAKENKDNTPKKDGKEIPSGKLKSELLRKKQNSKLNDSSGKKIEPSKKSLVSKAMKIVSTKVKKTTLSSPKLSEKKKLNVKSAAKDQIKTIIKKECPEPIAIVTDQKGASDNGNDSSTSDEITLDMLMKQHLMKQEKTCPPKRDADASIVVRNHSDCGDSVSSPASTRPDDSVSRMSEIVSSPMTVITSDEEDLKTMKNRIKVKIERKSEERSCSPVFINSDLEEYSKVKETDSGKAKAGAKKDTIKDEKAESKKSSESDEEKCKPKKMVKPPAGIKRVRGEAAKGSNGSDTEQRARRMKLFGFWSGPKRHRVASLNALAKVHCLYENESRGALYALCNASQIATPKSTKPSTTQASSRKAAAASTSVAPVSTRTLRSAPGLRGMGKHWDMHNASSTSSSSSSSSDENDSSCDSPAPSAPKPKVQRPVSKVALKKSAKQLKNVKNVVRRRRNKTELIMDLKDMVVRKRMASLNASAILAASYSMEKRSPKVAKEEGNAESDSNAKKKKKKLLTKKVVEVEEDTNSEVEVDDCGSSRSVIEVRTTPSNSSNKVAVIVNQDTDVTITGVYVNSTTRSTHHEGYCSIAGMQYRISSTSHTQTEATAVSTETVLHTSTAAEHPTPTGPPLAMPMKSYTPLGALSSMQPPGAPVSGGPAPHHHHLHPHPHPHPHPPCNVPPQQPPPPPPPPPLRGPGNPPPLSPLGRRHGCASAFSAPPSASYGPPPPPPPPLQQPPPHHHPPPPQGQQDPAYIHGYYQPAGPLISTHHHHHSSSSSSTSATNAGKAVLPTLEASPNPTPPPQPTSTTTTPQQIVSVTSASGGGDESSDNDVIITATSCSGGGEATHPPPPPPPPPPAAHHPSYRYPQTYPTPSTPQHIHHQSYTYNYPHTQYYPSPPASASIQYSTNPPGLQQHHHYHNQDLCYSSGTPSYPPATYFHHKSYSTPPPPPPPPTYHRRYIQQPPSHQYYPPELYAGGPASNGSQQSSAQSQQQQQQQMVVTGSTTGSASSYQLGVSSNPPLVETYPPPVSIVDPYPPPPGYYAGYSAGPGAAGCYSHSPPTRSLAFIDAAAYQTCPCPMQSCPKNVHTGPLTGDGKGPHLASKQTQPPSQESGASFHQLPLPPVALALPLEPPGALGPPSPARGSAGMPPPPSPATASARNPSHTQEISWESSSQQEASKPEPKVSESSVEVPQELQNKPDNTTLPSEEVRHRLLAISNIVPKPEAVVCRTKSKKRRSPPAADTAKPDNNVPLLMCDHEFRKKRQQNSSDIVVTKVDEVTILDSDLVCESVKMELKEVEKDTAVSKPQTEKEVADCRKVDQNDEKVASRKRKLDEPASETAKTENEATVPKRRKPSNVGLITNGLLAPGKDSAKTLVTETQDEAVKTATSQPKCKNAQKSQPLSSNSSLHNSKQQVRKRKLDDTKDLAENKEPQLSAPAKKKNITKAVKLQNTQTKVYPSRVVPSKKVSLKVSEVPKRVEEMVNSALAKSRTVLEPLANAKRNNSSNVTAVNKKTLGSKNVERKKSETRINGTLPCSKKASQKLPTTKVHDAVNSIDTAKSRASQCASNRGAVDIKKGQHKKKSEIVEVVSTKKSRTTNTLRSQLRDSLSDQTSSDDSESLPSKGKSSLVGTTRRLSSGSKKEQIKTSVKKPGSGIVRTDGHKKLQQSQEQQMDPEDKTNQETSQILAALSRRSAPKKTLQVPKWSNGWKFEGEPFENRVFLSSDDVSVIRKCYPLMRHEEGDVICPRDCILLKSGPRKTDLPFVAKVAALWENPEDGEMMVSLLWYYRPEHTDHGRRPDDMEDEIFASKHKDINSVACIEDKCYVLTFNEYCRYRKCVRRVEDGVKEPGLVVPQHDEYPRENRQPPGCVAPELVFFCRRVYDFRQRRILKNPG